MAEKLRQKSGYNSDGADLVDDCFGLGKEKKPMLALILCNRQVMKANIKDLVNLLKDFSACIETQKHVTQNF